MPRVLGGLRSIGRRMFQSIDELILENNYLPSLPGKAFHPLKITRLMLRYNGLQRVSNGWLFDLENILVELYIVEPELTSLPEGSLKHLSMLEAITIEANALKRLTSFTDLPRLNYIKVEAFNLLEISGRHFRNLPALAKIHIIEMPMLNYLVMNSFHSLPSLNILNITYCGLSRIYHRALNDLDSIKELSLIGNKITSSEMVGSMIGDLPNIETVRVDWNALEELVTGSFVDLPSLKFISISNNHIQNVQYGAFRRVCALKKLTLDNNQIRRVHPQSFLVGPIAGLQELRWFILTMLPKCKLSPKACHCQP